MHKKSKKFIKWRYAFMAAAVMVPALVINESPAQAEGCPELQIIFARGSGGTRWEDQNYLEFRDRIDEKLNDTGIDYKFIDLDYPAVGVGLDDLGTTLGAYFGGGEAYKFGESVNAGVKELTRIIQNKSCPETKYVLGGYSQGAMVVSKTLRRVDANKIIYAATFGDPKLYLPEGAGIMPAACIGANLSNYRMYVPDCYAYKGLLGAYIPYETDDYVEKLGTWCNKRDIFCSSHLSISDHVSYVSENLYDDASRVIASKVTTEFGVKNEYTSPHDTAILIDSTGSMSWMIDRFKSEAVRLANETFEAGGRVALYDYRDLIDPYEPVARCNFETCTAENFQEYLDAIVVDGGGDEKESLLSASMKVMHELSWRRGATKSLVVLTDAPFLSPDRDGTTAEDVIDLSKRIDPVNIYIITKESVPTSHPEVTELAEATGGFATSGLGELNLLTDYIMERYDTLPRVEELTDDSPEPTLEVTEVADDGGDTVTIKFTGAATGAIVILNDAVLGIAEGDTVTIGELNRDKENIIKLVPINESRKGETTEISLPIVIVKTTEIEHIVEIPVEQDHEIEEAAEVGKGGLEPTETKEVVVVPKTPDTGMVK